MQLISFSELPTSYYKLGVTVSVSFTFYYFLKVKEVKCCFLCTGLCLGVGVGGLHVLYLMSAGTMLSVLTSSLVESFVPHDFSSLRLV